MAYPKTRPPTRARAGQPGPARGRAAACSTTGPPTRPSRPRVDQRDAGANGANEYVFYDGPPFANGLPHYGHLLTGYVKDVVPRYQTMRGRRVERRFGWDCHGLPAEVEAEKQLGITDQGRRSSSSGVDKFNEACRDVGAALHPGLGALRHPPGPLGRLRQRLQDARPRPTWRASCGRSRRLHDKGLVYEGFRVLAYCWRCETPLSQHRDPDGRRLPGPAGPGADRVVRARPLDGRAGREDRWSGPPRRGRCRPTWPSRSGPTSTTRCFEEDGEQAYVGAARVGALRQGAGRLRPGSARSRARRWPGAATRRCSTSWSTRPARTRSRCSPPTSSPPRTAPASCTWRPAFGEDDQTALQRRRHPDRGHRRRPHPVHRAGAAVRGPAGLRGQQADHPRPQGRAAWSLRHDTYTHSYPHCWRCDTPLVYKAVSSWFVAVTTFRDRMVELNQQITWMPGHVKDGSFGKWLANARDWSISRNRFWGSPIPVWKSDDPAYPRVDVYGSLERAARPTSA